MKRRAWVAAVALVATIAMPAAALVEPGSAVAVPSLTDAWDRSLDPAKLRGRPVVFIYEDKDSATVNKAFKQRLTELRAEPRFRGVVVLPIADLSAYDFFPASAFAREAVRGESQKAGHAIFCDWNGTVGNALGAQKGKPNVVLVDATGRVSYAHAGPVQGKTLAAFESALAAAAR